MIAKLFAKQQNKEQNRQKRSKKRVHKTKKRNFGNTNYNNVYWIIIRH